MDLHPPAPPFRLPLRGGASALQALPILGPDLAYQMLTQGRCAVGPEIVVEIPVPRFQHPGLNPGLVGSGTQPLCRAVPCRIAVDGDVEALQPWGQQEGSEVTGRKRSPGRKAGGRLTDGQHGLDAFADDEDVITWGQPDCIAQKVAHRPPLDLDLRLVLAVRCKPGAMHALQAPCPIGDRSDQCWSGEALGLTLIPMPALWVEA